MTVQRFEWIVVAILFVVVAFTGGFALATMNARRVAFAGYQAGPGMMRGNTPFGYGARPRQGPQGGMMGPGGQMRPRYRGHVPNGRGNAPRLAPNQRRGVQPPTINPGQRPNPNNRLPNPSNRFPRSRRGA